MVKQTTLPETGKRILSAIPGVRKVFTGEAVKQDARAAHQCL